LDYFILTKNIKINEIPEVAQLAKIALSGPPVQGTIKAVIAF
jgi:hypothetical protein